jgi:hypothetical protein
MSWLPTGGVPFTFFQSVLYRYFVSHNLYDFLIDVYLPLGLSSVMGGTLSVLHVNIVLVSSSAPGMWFGCNKKHLTN